MVVGEAFSVSIAKAKPMEKSSLNIVIFLNEMMKNDWLYKDKEIREILKISLISISL